MCSNKYDNLEKEELKLNSIKAYIINNLIYKEKYLINNYPYDDMDKHLFMKVFSEIPDTINFGNVERRKVFLYSDFINEMSNQIISQHEKELSDRFYFLIKEKNVA